ncbi:MAG: alanine racemase [Bryobacterales bacterium]|nr:alanine racemase [Bryobacterales bacterium]
MESQLVRTPNSDALPPHRSFVEISLSRLAENYHSIAATLQPGNLIMPVVKANAYGHGAVQVAHKLVECGARWLAVSSTDEGIELREAGISLPVRILVMAGVLPFEWHAVVQHALTPVLHSISDLGALDQLSASTGSPMPFHFKVDTGLSRLGSADSAEEIGAAFASLRSAIPEGVMTHFASAADPRNGQAQQQLMHLRNVLRALRQRGIAPPIVHADSTNSLHHPPHPGTFQLVRPGHALYGYVSQPHDLPDGKLMVKPVLAWRTRVLLTKRLVTGTPVGYGALYHTTRPTDIAVLGIGYADGYPHRLSRVGHVLIHGHSAPILGAISMDLTTIDVTDLPEVRVGDVVTLLGSSGKEKIDAIDLARAAGTISYAILTNIHGRVKRIYVP